MQEPMTMEARLEALIRYRRENPDKDVVCIELYNSLINIKTLSEKERTLIRETWTNELKRVALLYWDDLFTETVVTGKFPYNTQTVASQMDIAFRTSLEQMKRREMSELQLGLGSGALNAYGIGGNL